MRTGIAMLTAVALLFAACGSEEKQLVEPDFFSKADFAERVLPKGQLDFGGEVRGTFTQDLEFHAYTIHAAAGSVVRIEVTQSGTSRGLDTAMYLYGPQRNDGNLGERIAHDDDSGWGPYPRLDDLVLEKMGTYTLVVGTADGMGRGDYRLVLNCLIDSCVSPDTPVEIREVDAPEALDDLIADANVPSYAYIRLWAFKWSGGGVETPSSEQIREPVAKWWLEQYEWEDDELPWEDEDELTTGQFDGQLSEYDMELGEFERAAGLSPFDYRVFTASYEYGCYMGVTCWETLLMVVSWSTDDLYVLVLGAGEE